MMSDTQESEASSPLRWVVGIGVGLLVVVSVLGYVVAASLQQLRPAPYAILPPATGGETVASVPATSVVPATSEAAIFKPAAASSSALSVASAGSVAVVALPPAGAPLVRTLQDRLSAAGCYDGATNGYWTTRTREAMARFVAAVDARLSVREPDSVLLALIETNAAVRCGSASAGRPAPAIVTVAATASTDGEDEQAAVNSVTTLLTSDDTEDEAPSDAAGTDSGAATDSATLAAGAAAVGAAAASRKRSATVADDDDDDDDARPARSSRASRSNAYGGSSRLERSYRPRRQPDVLRGMKTVSRQMTRNMRSVGRSLSRLFR
jgi:hypothetical protein